VIGCLEVIRLCIVLVVLPEDWNKPQIKAVHEHITYAHRKTGLPSKWPHAIHHTLIIGKDCGGDHVPFTVDIGLLDMVKGSMRLTGISRADLGKNGGA
jgi:hypothetical protein